MNLEKGCQFFSYEDFEKSLEVYKKKNFTEYSISQSARLQLYKNRIFSARIQNAPAELKYYFIKFSCIHGGVLERYKSYSGLRKTSSKKINCPAQIFLKLSSDGKSLIVEELVENHNHEISPENFRRLPKQRRLDPEDQREVMQLFKLNANIRLVKEKYSALTNKNITMKDMYNLAAKARSLNYSFETCKNPDVEDESATRSLNYSFETCKNLDVEDESTWESPVVQIDQVPSAASLSTAQKFENVTACKNPNVEYESTGKHHPLVRIDPVPRSANLTTTQKFTKVSALTNKLALLASQSSSFDEQMAFLQSVHDSWVNGKVALEIQEKSNKTPHMVKVQAQPKGLNKNKRQPKGLKTTAIGLNKNKRQPKGLKTTVIGLNKNKRQHKANDTPSSSSPIVENGTPNTILGPVDHTYFNSYNPPIQRPSKTTSMPIIVESSEK